MSAQLQSLSQASLPIMSTSATLLDLPVNISTLSEQEKGELIVSDTVSIASDTTAGVTESAFTPLKSLHVHAKGIGIISQASAPPEELITTITNPDGSLAYTSSRARRCSGSCTLSDEKGKNVVRTEYFFGPNRDPILKKLYEENDKTYEINTLSKWTSRNHRFLPPDGHMFEWRYKKGKGFGTNGSKGTALLLRVGEKCIAMLVRNDETRTLGTKSYSAGNGGELLLGEDADGRAGITEDLIVATCLLMLKKETDRRRTVQCMVLAALFL